MADLPDETSPEEVNLEDESKLEEQKNDSPVESSEAVAKETDTLKTEHEHSNEAAQDTVKKKPGRDLSKKNRKGDANTFAAIAVATVVALLLIGLAFVALKSDEDNAASENDGANTSNTSAGNANDPSANQSKDASTDEVINELDGIIEEINTSDDFSEDTLSDESLGL